MPGYDQYVRYREVVGKFMQLGFAGAAQAVWEPDGKGVAFRSFTERQWKRRDMLTGAVTDIAQPPQQQNRGFQFAPRGEQLKRMQSPDGKLTAESKDNNVSIVTADGKRTAVTTDGSVAARIKYGTASWVYGEELAQDKAMWWSPDGKKLAYYRFDEKAVPDYYMAMNQRSFQTTLDVEAYPKPGNPNPIADLFIYDIAAKKSVKVDSKFGPNGADVGHYVYNVAWSPDGKHLTFFRMSRAQNLQQWLAADRETGACRVVFEESNPSGWVEFKPTGPFPSPTPDIHWLDGRPGKFLWISDRSGFRNVYLGDFTAGGLKPVTSLKADVNTIVMVDLAKNHLWYTAFDGEIPYRQQLHRVSLDGTGETRLTDPKLSHGVIVSPTGNGFVDIAQTLSEPPVTRLCDASGKVIATLAQADKAALAALPLKPVERFTFKAADGKTDLYGYYSKPMDFDPKKKYPLLLSCYSGPGFGSGAEAFQPSEGSAQMGFIVAWVDGRGSIWRGRDFAQAVYKKLGIVEIDDQVAGIKHLTKLPFVDPERVGIFGSSYGGYTSLLAAVRYPDLIKAASIGSPVTDWRNYDTTYTERYMGELAPNKAAYDAGSALTYLKNLKARILLWFGTSDNNVHPSNTIQLISALDELGKSYELTLGPDEGHGDVNELRRLEFFMDHLVLGKR